MEIVDFDFGLILGCYLVNMYIHKQHTHYSVCRWREKEGVEGCVNGRRVCERERECYVGRERRVKEGQNGILSEFQFLTSSFYIS